YKEKSISDELEAIISERTVKYSKDKNILPLFKEDQKEYTSQVIMPIISASGDCIGSIVVVSKDKDTI
ncbi:stage V sporulation protein T, partial [Clostridioides difficile]